MTIPFIDLKTQYQAIKSDVDQRIQKVLEHGQYIMGPEVKEAEADLATFTGCKHALTVSNGSDALLMAFMALGIGRGDEVITTPFSFIATAEMILLAGATPVYVDIDSKTYNLDPQKVAAAVTPRTKAIMPVSLYGQTYDADAIQTIADKHDLWVIEDAAQSFGATYKGKRSGNLSDIGCTSFFPAKPLGCYGDGGAVFTNDDELAQLLQSVRIHGMGEHRYHHPRLGINGRLDSIQCAVICAKLKRYPAEIQRRNEVAKNYTEAFGDLKKFGVTTPFVQPNSVSVWAQYTLSVPNRTEFQKKLQDHGVPTAIHYPIPMPDQPGYTKNGVTHDITNARRAAEVVVSLPMYPDMPKDIQLKIISAVRSVYT